MIWKLFVISLAVFGCSSAFASKRSYDYGSEKNYENGGHQCPEAAFLGQLFVSLAETFNNMAQQLARYPQMNNHPNHGQMDRHGDHHGYRGHRGHHHGYGHNQMPLPQAPFYRAPPVDPLFGRPPPPTGSFYGPPPPPTGRSFNAPPPPPGGPLYGRQPPPGGPFGPPPFPGRSFYGPPPPPTGQFGPNPFFDGPFATPFQGLNPFLKTPNPPAKPPPVSTAAPTDPNPFVNPNATFSNPTLKTPNPPEDPPKVVRPAIFSMFVQSPQFPNKANTNWTAISQMQAPSQPLPPHAQPESQTKDRSWLDHETSVSSQDLKDIRQNIDSDSESSAEPVKDIDQPTEDNEKDSDWNELVYSIFDDHFTPPSGDEDDEEGPR